MPSFPPRVSFVVPTRNQAPFLRRCLDGCLAQGLRDFEIVVADGLSTDETVAILRSYGDRISFQSEPDSGQADAVNKAVARASGEVIAWINSDDYYAGPDCVAAALAAFEDPLVDLAYGEGQVVLGDGSPLRPYRNRTFASARDLLLSPIGPSQPATFFRRSLFLAVGGLDPGLHYALDYDLMLRLFAQARRLRRIPRTIACMTFHPDAKSIQGMLPQIREVSRVKARHAEVLGLGRIDRLRLAASVGVLYAYFTAVRAGLRRAS